MANYSLFERKPFEKHVWSLDCMKFLQNGDTCGVDVSE